MKKLKILITVIVMFNLIAIAKGQDNMVIHLAGNNNVTVAISDIQRITFNGNNMLLKPRNGSANSYLLDNIASITFLNGSTGVAKEIGKDIEVKFYLNSNNEIVVESPYSITELTVFDLTGKTVTTTFSSPVNVNSLSTGVYLLKIETSEGTVTKKFIKNR